METEFDPMRDSALDPSASAEVLYPWERAPALPAERVSVLFAGEPLEVTETQRFVLERLTDITDA